MNASSAVFACGNCLYGYWSWKYPPVRSLCFIFPGWLVVLALVKSIKHEPVPFVPPAWISIPLVLAVFLFAPGTAGPILGAWIPLLCLIATVACMANHNKDRRPLVEATALLAIGLAIVFGAKDCLDMAPYGAAPPTLEAYIQRGHLH